MQFPVDGTGDADGPGPGERLDQPGGDVALHRLVPGGDLGQVGDVRADQDGEDGQPDEEGQGQPRVDEGEGDDAAHRGYEHGRGRHDRRTRLPGVADLRDGTADQVPGPEPLGGPQAEEQHVPYHGMAQPRGGPGARRSRREVGQGIGTGQGGDQRDRAGQPPQRSGVAQRGVDRTPQDRGQQQLGADADQRGGGQDRQPRAAQPDRPRQQPVPRVHAHPLGPGRRSAGPGPWCYERSVRSRSRSR